MIDWNKQTVACLHCGRALRVDPRRAPPDRCVNCTEIEEPPDLELLGDVVPQWEWGLKEGVRP